MISNIFNFTLSVISYTNKHPLAPFKYAFVNDLYFSLPHVSQIYNFINENHFYQ